MRVEVTRTFKRIIQFRYENGSLKVLAHWLVSQKRLKQIISENTDWINKQKEKCQTENKNGSEQSQATSNNVQSKSDMTGTKAPAANESDDMRDFFMIKKALIFGSVYAVKPNENSKTFADGNTIYVCEKSYSSRELRAKALKSYIKKVAQTYVSMEISQFGSEVSICPAKIELKELTNGWVRCQQAAQKVLCLDYRIAQLPRELQRYLIAHAFAHFIELTHDEKYWKTLSKMCPNYETLRKRLEKYEFILDI